MKKRNGKSVTVTAGGGFVTVNGKKYKGNGVSYYGGDIYVDGVKVHSKEPERKAGFQWMSDEPRKPKTGQAKSKSREEAMAWLEARKGGEAMPTVLSGSGRFNALALLDFFFMILCILPIAGLAFLFCKGVFKSVVGQ
jgi:hypothetical protein